MPRRKRPVIGIDYIMDSNGRAQFTREYLLRGGTCCEHECKYCPYQKNGQSQIDDSQIELAVGGMNCGSVLTST